MDIIEQIDAVTEPQCGWCGKAGADFCNETHQELWTQHFRLTGQRVVTAAGRAKMKADRHTEMTDMWAKHHVWYAVDVLGASTAQEAVELSRQRGVGPGLLDYVREVAKLRLAARGIERGPVELTARDRRRIRVDEEPYIERDTVTRDERAHRLRPGQVVLYDGAANEVAAVTPCPPGAVRIEWVDSDLAVWVEADELMAVVCPID